MPGMNPVILIQLLMQYHNDELSRLDAFSGKTSRKFVFNRNNRMKVHNETPEEVLKRKSCLDIPKLYAAKTAARKMLQKSLSGKLGKVWIDPAMKKMAVPIQMQTGESGFGILPTGSRIPIPEGKFIRAFTYWEKVNDIDLSGFALSESGEQKEFSWRNMYHQQSDTITFSGDQTSGYNGGSEYFDINLDKFRTMYDGYRYVVFCNNVYSNSTFSQCDCKAGFMIREENPELIPKWKGEREPRRRVSAQIFDPKTVQTSFRINADASFAYLFAIDLKTREMIWLNMARAERMAVAGTSNMDVLLRYFTVMDVFNVFDLYAYSGTVVERMEEADTIVTDHEIDWYQLPVIRPDNWEPEVIHSWDYEKMLKLLQPVK